MKNQLDMRRFSISLIYLLAIYWAPFEAGAQSVTGGPGQPEFSSFEPFGSGSQVSNYTGNFAYAIPALSIPGPNGNYGMSLFYHGGITMDQVASWAGLGWNINPWSENWG